MTFYQLNPPIPMQAKELPFDRSDETVWHSGEAVAVLDYHSEQDLIWVIALDEDGTIWATPNHKVRLFKNWSIGRNFK